MINTDDLYDMLNESYKNEPIYDVNDLKLGDIVLIDGHMLNDEEDIGVVVYKREEKGIMNLNIASSNNGNYHFKECDIISDFGVRRINNRHHKFCERFKSNSEKVSSMIDMFASTWDCGQIETHNMNTIMSVLNRALG